MSKIVASDKIDWNHVLALDCSFTVDTIKTGKFVQWMADKIAREDCTCVRKNGKLISDYRSKNEK